MRDTSSKGGNLRNSINLFLPKGKKEIFILPKGKKWEKTANNSENKRFHNFWFKKLTEEYKEYNARSSLKYIRNKKAR